MFVVHVRCACSSGRLTSGLVQVFGPVLVVRDFSDEEAAVAEANSTPYGTAAPRPACTVGLGYLEGDCR